MENTQQILVIVLASMLAIFLALGIVALTKLIQLLDHLKRISEKAEKLANTAETVGEFFKYTAGPAAIGKLLANISNVIHKRKKAGGHDDE